VPPQTTTSTNLFTTYLVSFILRRYRAILAVTAVLVALGAWRASKLELRTNLAELLPAQDPAVVVLRDTDRRMAALSSIQVVVEGPDPTQNRRYVDDLVPRLKAIRGTTIDDVVSGVQEEQAFFHRNRFLYAPLDELAKAHDRLEREIQRRKNPLIVDLDSDGEESHSIDDEVKRFDKKEKELLDKYPDGYFASRDRTLYAVVIWVRSSLFGDARGDRALAEVRSAVAALDPARYDPKMQVGLAGSILTSGEERKSLENDLILATSICVVLVCLSVFLFYGRIQALPFFATPAFIGVTLAMAFAQLTFGYLNSSTTFMGSIILGNGINYAIIQMARYEEERRAGRSVEEALPLALGGTWKPTAMASLSAAISYGALVVTSFRGFNQFGYIGGVGMLLSWLATILVLPALWVAFDRRGAEHKPLRVRGYAAAAPFGRLVVRYPWVLLGLGSVVTILAVLPIGRYARDPFEYNFNRLRSQASRDSASERRSTKLNPIFGRSRSPNFILARDPSQVEEIRAKLRAADAKVHVLGDVKTVNDFLPGTPTVQAEKLELLGKIRTLIDTHLDLLDESQRAELLKLRPPETLRPIQPQELPRSIRRLFTENDGTIGRPVLYQPREDINVWDGHTLIKLAELVQNIRLDNGETIQSSGSAVVFAAMLRAIVHDGPIVTLVALLGVILSVLLLTRDPRGSTFIIFQLLIGVLWMIGAAAGEYVRINFLNFVALPITFGIGVDYGVNLYARHREDGPGRIAASVAAVGGAVALCSLTTIIGYGTLLVADNYALRSFGALAILGEFACLTASLAIFPAALELMDRRRAARAGGDAPRGGT
jgi:hypothetical protein